MKARPAGDVQITLSGDEARGLYAELYRISVDLLGNSYEGVYPRLRDFFGLLDDMGYDS